MTNCSISCATEVFNFRSIFLKTIRKKSPDQSKRTYPTAQNAPTRGASRRILLLCFKRRLFLPPVYILSELSSALFGNESLAGKVNLAVGFDFDYANKNFIADADNILNALNALVGEF